MQQFGVLTERLGMAPGRPQCRRRPHLPGPAGARPQRPGRAAPVRRHAPTVRLLRPCGRAHRRPSRCVPTSPPFTPTWPNPARPGPTRAGRPKLPRGPGLRPDYPEALNNLGLALHELGRHDEAVAQFEAALALRPDFAMAQNNRGTRPGRWARPPRPWKRIGQRVTLDPTLARAHTNLGQMLTDQGQWPRGWPTVARPCDIGPTWPPATTTWAMSCAPWSAGPRRLAYAEAIRLEPGLAVAHANLGWHSAGRQVRRRSPFPASR